MTLTTEHATSSYGQPVLVVDGVAYGYMDLVPASGGGLAETIPDLAAEPAWLLVLAEWQHNQPLPQEVAEWADAGLRLTYPANTGNAEAN